MNNAHEIHVGIRLVHLAKVREKRRGLRRVELTAELGCHRNRGWRNVPDARHVRKRVFIRNSRDLQSAVAGCGQSGTTLTFTGLTHAWSKTCSRRS